MVFFSCLVVTFILYFLQSDGLIYVMIVAVLAEVLNLFVMQTSTATAKNDSQKKYTKIINSHMQKINHQRKTIKQLSKIRDDAIHKLYKANQSIKKYEDQLGIEDSEAIDIPQKRPLKPIASQTKDEETQIPEEEKKEKDHHDHLPDGSGRKQLPI